MRYNVYIIADLLGAALLVLSLILIFVFHIYLFILFLFIPFYLFNGKRKKRYGRRQIGQKF